MTVMTERLIELVRCEPCLYNTNHQDYTKKTLKQLLWVKIAKELKYKDGPSAKNAWLKLRNCHRDAIRRRNKGDRSGSAATVTKPWKFEKQMEFLVTYMINRPATGNMSTGNTSTENQNLQPEILIQEDEFEHNEIVEVSSEVLSHNSTGNNSNEHSVSSFQFLPPDITGNNSTEDSVMYKSLPSPISHASQIRIPHVAPPVVKESKAKKFNLNTLIANTLQNHEKRKG